MASEIPNPFVGPKPLDVGDGIYGRDEDIRELLWFFTAERIVWLHSPSGSGKTSLVQAGLIPKLEADEFTVLPTIRVNRESTLNGNRYEASVLSCLGGQANLAEFLAAGARGISRVLIFDQFEEILTLDSTDIEVKNSFFATLGRALRQPDLWALFVVREDLLPALDPYVGSIPTLMNNRFRLDLLTIEHSREAMEQIARRGGREFAPGGSHALAEELAKVITPSVGGGATKTGRFVEPVILQVVCRSMWEGIPEAETTIREVPKGDKVTKSLSSFYASCVKAVAPTLSQERAVRKWIAEKLIVLGFRNQVLDASGDGAGLGARLIEKLVQTHLIRREDRGDRTWYELAHDRLVDPILADNRRWEEENLHWVLRRAELWRLQEQPKGLLMVDDDLASAELWIEQSQPQLTDSDREFLRQSREEQDARDKLRRRTIYAWCLLGLVTLLLLTVTFFYLRDGAAQQIDLARNQIQLNQPGCAAQAAASALTRARLSSPSLYIGATRALRDAVALAAYFEADRLDMGGKIKLAFSPVLSLLAIAQDKKVTLYPVPSNYQTPSEHFQNQWLLEPACAAVTTMSLSPNDGQVAVGLSDGTSAILSPDAKVMHCGNTPDRASVEGLSLSRAGDLAVGTVEGVFVNGKRIFDGDVRSLAFDRDGKRLAIGLGKGEVQVLDLNGRSVEGPFTGFQGKPVSGICWLPGGLALVSRTDSTLLLLNDTGEVIQKEAADSSGIDAVTVSPSGARIAIVGAGGDIQIWQTNSQAPPLKIEAPAPDMWLDLVFRDESHLIASRSDGAVKLLPVASEDWQKTAAEFSLTHPCVSHQ